MAFTVRDMAQLAGVSVRTLHHYDAVGLLKPSGRSASGYRLYSEQDRVVLQQVLFFRELGFPLREIRGILQDPQFDQTEALRLQRRMLQDQARHVQSKLDAVQRALEALEGGKTMDKDEVTGAAAEFDPAPYAEEARQRWGHTDAYQESQRRSAKYKKEDWQAIRAEGDAINQRLAELLDRKRAPSDQEVQDTVRRHWKMINDRFYPCPPDLYAGLGQMYVEDPRFTATYERVRPGLAVFLRDAIQVFAAALRRVG